MEKLTQQLRIDSVENLLILATAAAKTETWFRGHGDAAWKLQPKTHRPDFVGDHNEHLLMQQFRSQAGPVMSKPPPSEELLDWLCLMQHYGLPTRMLDWTRSPLVAAYFAIWESENDAKDGCIWFVVPSVMNQAMGGNPVRPGAGDSVVDTICTNAFVLPHKRAPAERKYVAINSFHTDNRQMLQQSELGVTWTGILVRAAKVEHSNGSDWLSHIRPSTANEETKMTGSLTPQVLGLLSAGDGVHAGRFSRRFPPR